MKVCIKCASYTKIQGVPGRWISVPRPDIKADGESCAGCDAPLQNGDVWIAGRECAWRCGDTATEHEHFAVSIRENGRLLGRLAPDGTATKRNLFALVLSKAAADDIASQINERGEFTAKVIPF